MKSSNIEPVIFLAGVTSMLRRHIDLRRASLPRSATIHRISLADSVSGGAHRVLVGLLSMNDMFAPYRLVVATDFDGLGAADANLVLNCIEKFQEHLVRTCLVVTMGKKHRSKRINDRVGGIAELVVLNTPTGKQLEHVIREDALRSGLSLDHDLMGAMVQSAETGYDNVLQSIEQLSQLLNVVKDERDERSAVRVVTLEEFRMVRLNSRSIGVFDFVDAFFLRKKAKSHLIFAQLTKDEESPVKLNALLSSQARRVLLAASGDLEHLNVHPYVAKKAKQQSKYWEVKELSALLAKLEETDGALKTGGGASAPLQIARLIEISLTGQA